MAVQSDSMIDSFTVAFPRIFQRGQIAAWVVAFAVVVSITRYHINDSFQPGPAHSSSFKKFFFNQGIWNYTENKKKPGVFTKDEQDKWNKIQLQKAMAASSANEQGSK